MPVEECMSFGPLTIWYDADGLRPRPWTQLQSTWAAELLAALPEGDVLELCAGFGQIGLLALVAADRTSDPSATARRLVQVDTSETVGRLAARNAALVGLANRVRVLHEPAERSLDAGDQFVLVIADPPWVPSDRVRDFPQDPPWAIDGGPDGLRVVRALLPVVERHLHPQGAVLLQVGGPDQADRVSDLLDDRGSPLAVVDVRAAPAGEAGAVALLSASTGGTSWPALDPPLGT